MTPPTLPTGPVPIDTGTAELVGVSGDPTAVLLLVNGAESSQLDLADPARLEFEYMQQMVEVLDAVFDPPARLRALHLGAGACALPRAIEARRPGSAQTAVDVDGALARLVREWFDLPRSPRLRLRVQDARDAVRTTAPARLDVIVRDVFTGRAVPPHVRTVEFTRLVAAALRPGGVYLVNCIDAPPLAVGRREAATLRAVFPHVGLITERAILKGRRYGNLVFVGAFDTIPDAPLARRLRSLPLPVTLLTGPDLEAFAGAAPPYVDGAPPLPPD